MIGLPRSDDEGDRITVKIRNKKRKSSRRSKLWSKRTLSRIRRYDDSSDESISSDESRRRDDSPMPRRRHGSPYREDHRPRVFRKEPVRAHYKVLCVSALHPKVSDEAIKDTLFKEYKEFGDFFIKISHDLGERVAYVCFRNPEDARDALHSRAKIIFYDQVAMVGPVCDSMSSDYRNKLRSINPPDYDWSYMSQARYPKAERRMTVSGDRSFGMPLAVPTHYGDFRPSMYDYDMARPQAPSMYHHPPMHYPTPYYTPRSHYMPFEQNESKRVKFPNHLKFNLPEDDPLATRTLFAGNLDINITEKEIRRLFGYYGIIEDVDIKRPLPGTGNAFAFVRYQNLDMAHRAKVELTGHYIGKLQCKIGYGKPKPSTRVWVGGLGSWTTVAQLEKEFDRFGAIKKIEYSTGGVHAYILYDSLDAAQAAVTAMRGFPLGGPDKRLRTDFADVGRGPFKTQQYGPFVAENSLAIAARSVDSFEGYDGNREDDYISILPGNGGKGGQKDHERGK